MSMKHTVLVTCARGTVGAETVGRLASAGLDVKAGVRTAGELGMRHPRVREVVCDFENRSSLQAALDGVQSLVLITPVDPASADYAARSIDAAKVAGVQHIVRLSGAIATLADTALGSWHASAESHLARSGIPHSVLRPTLFMQNFATYYRPDSLGYFYVASGDACANYVDVRDVADVAAHLVETRAVSTSPLLITGPEPIRSKDVALCLSAVSGRTIRSGRISPRQAALAMRLMGLPRWAVAAFRQIHELICEGFYDCTSNAVSHAVARPPRSVSEFASDHAATFADPGAGWPASLGARILLHLAPT
jgi:uncharacterized protein YbjT (DUF2867 family)